MATYCIGDVHGCYDQLLRLLELINYDQQKDHLWFVGDLVNRGRGSLAVLRLINELPNVKMVLGNHELHLMGLYQGVVNFEFDILREVLMAEDVAELIDWLRKQPVMFYDARHVLAVVHAGIYPAWTLEQAISYASEINTILTGSNWVEFLRNMYGNVPIKWNNNLKGWSRYRFIVNAFTRMRFCSKDGVLRLDLKGEVGSAPADYFPWFRVPERKTENIRIIFGHWAALKGHTEGSNVMAIDSGCVWGRALTAYRLEDETKFNVNCPS